MSKQKRLNRYLNNTRRLLFVDNQGLLQQGSLSSLDEQQYSDFVAKLNNFTQTQWRITAERRRFRWDMAILVDTMKRCHQAIKTQ